MAKPKNNLLILGITLGVIVLAIIIYFAFFYSAPSSLDTFAQCINQKGAALYGTFWCTHCQNQKRLFGSSVQYIPYVECSSPDGRSQLQACAEKEIKGYPTWIFADGTRVEGEMSLSMLSDKTGCPLTE